MNSQLDQQVADTLHALLAKKPEDNMAVQLKEVIMNDMLVTMFPNLHKMASISLTLPVSTASVENQKLLSDEANQNSRANSLSEVTLAQLMRIAIESPEKLTEDDLEVLDVWNRKPRRVPI